MKVATVVGARPQFVKAAVVSVALRRRHEEVLVHTGQHYDWGLSRRFFDELGVPSPHVDLGVGSGTHAEQTAAMLVRLERVLQRERPDLVLVHGDTNSTLAGALAAAKLGLPLAHVEAGLRSFDRSMPEEVNRVVTDRLSDLLFGPTAQAVANLAREGIRRGVHRVGDVTYDAFLAFRERVDADAVLRRLRLRGGAFVLATVHRAANTDDEDRLRRIVAGLARCGSPVVFPVHPRTRAALRRARVRLPASVRALAPVGYLEMLALESSARAIATDSGGVQKEAFFARVPCVTLREETEWVETVRSGWNRLAGSDPGAIARALAEAGPGRDGAFPYGDGRAAERIVRVLERFARRLSPRQGGPTTAR